MSEPISRILYVTTANTGGSLDVPTAEGMIQARRYDPFGVQLMAAGQVFSIPKSELPLIARFYAAAAIRLDVDLNQGWDAFGEGLVLP